MKKIILYILPIISFSSCMLFQPSAKKLTNRALSATKQYDAVIVPGVPFLGSLRKLQRPLQLKLMLKLRSLPLLLTMKKRLKTVSFSHHLVELVVKLFFL